MKFKIFSILILVLFVFNFSVLADGKIFLGGGALQDGNENLWQGFYDATSKDSPVVAVFCSAEGSLDEAKEEYYQDTEKYMSWENLFKKYDFKPVFIPIAIDNAEKAAYNEENIKKVKSADAIWFNGGNQNLHVDSLVNDNAKATPLLKAVYEVFDNGGVVGGTSAGTAIMSDPMIGAGKSLASLLDGVTNKDNYSNPDDNRVFIRNGFDFFNKGIVDQHFIKRGRLGRLIRAANYTESEFAIGVDENTAALINGNEVSVYGESGVIILDLRDMKVNGESNFSDIRLHYLAQGDSMNIVNGEYETNEAKDLSLIGDEYYAGNELNSDIFAEDAVKDIVTKGLIDNTESIAQGISFRMVSENKAEGIKVIFKENENSSGYFGKVNGENSYAVYNIEVEVIPINLEIKNKEN